MSEAPAIEQYFSNAQPVSGIVQDGRGGQHSCCSHTALVISGSHAERAYTLKLPLKTSRPNESTFPAVNVRYRVMRADGVPVFEVLSGPEPSPDLELVSLSASGPPECPPGEPNTISLSSEGSEVRKVPFLDWVFPAPAALPADIFARLTKSLLALYHPLKLSSLPARSWAVEVRGCRQAPPGLTASIRAFPAIEWRGDFAIAVKPGESGAPAVTPVLDGDLAVTYGGRSHPIEDYDLARSLSTWFGLVEELGKVMVSIDRLVRDEKSEGYDTRRLALRDEFRWDQLPTLRMALTSRLFQQQGNGLLGHELSISLRGEPVAGASGERNLLATLLSSGTAAPLIQPMLHGFPSRRLDEVSSVYGLYLVAEGGTFLRASVQGRRPLEPWSYECSASGGTHLRLEARSAREYETLVVYASAADDPALWGGLSADCKPPVNLANATEVADAPFLAHVGFTGLRLHAVIKSAGGISVTTLPPVMEPDPEKPSSGPRSHQLLPDRHWPAGAQPGKCEPVPWF